MVCNLVRSAHRKTIVFHPSNTTWRPCSWAWMKVRNCSSSKSYASSGAVFTVMAPFSNWKNGPSSNIASPFTTETQSTNVGWNATGTAWDTLAWRTAASFGGTIDWPTAEEYVCGGTGWGCCVGGCCGCCVCCDWCKCGPFLDLVCEDLSGGWKRDVLGASAHLCVNLPFNKILLKLEWQLFHLHSKHSLGYLAGGKITSILF